MVAAIDEANALSSVVSAVVEVESESDLISEALVRRNWLVCLRMSDRGQRNQPRHD